MTHCSFKSFFPAFLHLYYSCLLPKAPWRAAVPLLNHTGETMELLPTQQDYVQGQEAALVLSSANCFCLCSSDVEMQCSVTTPQTALTQLLLQKSRAKLEVHCVITVCTFPSPSLPLPWFPGEWGPVFVIMTPEPGSLPDMWYSLNVYWKNGIICCFHNEHEKRMIKVKMISSDSHKRPRAAHTLSASCFEEFRKCGYTYSLDGARVFKYCCLVEAQFPEDRNTERIKSLMIPFLLQTGLKWGCIRGTWQCH